MKVAVCPFGEITLLATGAPLPLSKGCRIFIAKGLNPSRKLPISLVKNSREMVGDTLCIGSVKQCAVSAVACEPHITSGHRGPRGFDVAPSGARDSMPMT